jgi:sugar-specific transcriptional regulator TrmB
VQLLQELGLKEYESRSFVALARVSHGTAKDISELSEVPRTRVYDAVRVLESKGLVEIQHTNPQQFRAVSITEASETLRKEYEQRVESLESTLETLEPLGDAERTDTTHEVWSLSGEQAISTRTADLVGEATSEVVLVIGDADVFTEETAAALQRATARDVAVTVVTTDESTRELVASVLPAVTVVVAEFGWLHPNFERDDGTRIDRLLLADRSTILVSTVSQNGDGRQASAIFGRGFNNGFVTILRRLLSFEGTASAELRQS